MALLTDRKFIHFNKKEDFLVLLNANAIADWQIVFIGNGNSGEEAPEIWTHGTYYGSVEQFLDETNKDSTNAISAAAVYKALTDDEKTIAAALNDLNDRIENLDIPSKVSDLTDDLSLATLGYVDDKLDDVLGVSAAGVEAFVNMTRDEDTATGILTEIANKALKTNAVNGAPLSNTESYFYGTSTTAAATALKEVSIPSITSLKTGQIIVVKPTITSTVANSTIKLNNFTAYPMRYNNAAITISTNSVVWNASFPSIWVFDGNYWVFLGHGFDNNTTYYAMSQGEATTGTATTARIISAKVLNDTIEGHTKLSSSYQPSSLENDDLILDGGDTYETAFGKLEKSINDNEQITAAALTDLDSRINTLHLPQSLDDIPDGSTRKLSTKQDALVSGTNIKTINNQSLLGSGNITIQGGSGGDTNVIETVKVNGTALTPDANKAVDIPIDVVVVNWYDKFVGKSYFNMEDGDTGSLTANEISELASLIQANDKYVIIRGATSPGDYIYYKFAYDTGQFWDFVSHALGAKYTLRVDYRGNNTWTFRKRVEGIINGVKVNGTELTPDNSNKVNISVPSAVTESTVSGWGFTKNAGTITGITMNGASKGTSGIVDLGTVLTSFTETDPTVPAWAKASSKPTYTAAEVGALPDTYTPPVTSVNGLTGAINLTIPSAPGTLNTTATTAQSTNSSEALSGNITLHKVAKTGTYNDLIGKPTIPAAQVQSDWNATSGMGVILNKPTIPTVNNAILTIQKNGTTVNTFTANASSNVTANIQVNELPTVSSSDNGKILQVVNGAWSLVMPTAIYTGSSTPSNSLGNDGDIYVQS